MESQSTSSFAGSRVHFIGIGGCGMSGLARVLMDCGAIVSGSDPSPNQQTRLLELCGAKITTCQDGAMLCDDYDLVVRTAAVKDDNPEFLRAVELRLEHKKYAQVLGEVLAERFGVAVAGTHGKTTTTSMIAYALMECDADPSFVIGGHVAQLGGSSRSGAGRPFVVEACEFDRSFHSLHPKVALITNIEAEHLDCYPGGIREIIKSFRQFASLVPEDGLVIANARDRHVLAALKGLSRPVETVAVGRATKAPDASWQTIAAGRVEGCYCGHVHYRGHPVATLKLSIPGRHNLYNATMALAACAACGVDVSAAADAIGRFKGVDRRMTEMGSFHGATIVDDYGHHPTEIRTTLRALRDRYRPKRLLCVFQPHQHSRTRLLLKGFAASFGLADETIVPDIYSVRDSDAERKRVNSSDLVEQIRQRGAAARHIPQFAEVISYLQAEARPGDLIVTMGAGNVWEVGRQLAER